MDQETIALNLISNSGTARSLAFEALDMAKNGKFEETKELLRAAGESSLLAHKAQTELLQAEANGNTPEYSILMVHAQDHLMTSMLAKELIEQMIEMYKKFNK